MARSLVRQQDTSELRGILNAAEPHLGRWYGARIQPTVDNASRVQWRAHGVALCSSSVTGPGRTFRQEGSHSEEQLLDIEFREDGSIFMIMGRATVVTPRNDHKNMMIYDDLIVAYIVRLLEWTHKLACKVNYRGQWAFGIHVSRLRGLMGHHWSSHFYNGPTFDTETYREVTTTTFTNLEDNWQQVASELVGRLVHALGTAHQYNDLLGTS